MNVSGSGSTSRIEAIKHDTLQKSRIIKKVPDTDPHYIGKLDLDKNSAATEAQSGTMEGLGRSQ
jgi:hypothetical protein